MFYDKDADHDDWSEYDYTGDEYDDEDDEEVQTYDTDEDDDYDSYESYESEDIEEDEFRADYDVTPDYVVRCVKPTPVSAPVSAEPKIFMNTRAPWINHVVQKTSMADIMRQEQKKKEEPIREQKNIEQPVKKKVSLLRGNDIRTTDTHKERHRLCKYGEKCHPSKRCELAHSLREWHPKTCRFRDCKQKACNFRHDSETNAQYLTRCLQNKTCFYFQNRDFYVRFLS
jgi:hypothetical protein